MKYITVILLMLVSSFAYCQGNDVDSQVSLDDIVFQDLDQNLMKVWLLGRQANGSQLDEKFKSCQKEWLFVKKKLLATDLPHVNVEEFVSDLDYYYKLLATSVGSRDYLNIEKMSYHIMYEFRSLRQCYFYSSYSLDQLWDVIDVYQSIDFTIDDPMMDLKEWHEFEDMINDMICNWENYDYLHISEIQKFYPGMNKNRHSTAKEDINSCTFSLLIAIETAMQDKFKLPCDQLGDAFEELIQLYAYSKPSVLM